MPVLAQTTLLLIAVPFAVLHMKEPLKLDYVWVALCILGAVYFMFRGHPA